MSFSIFHFSIFIFHRKDECFGSFLLQDLFSSLQAFAFKGQNMTFTVNMLLTCILYCDAGPDCD